MTVKNFVEKGGDLETLEFKELSDMNASMDVSFAQQTGTGFEDAAVSTGGRSILKAKGKREAEMVHLVQSDIEVYNN